MREVIRGRRIVADEWRYPGEEGEPRVLPLPEFLAASAAASLPSTVGMSLLPEDEPARVAALLPAMSLVVILFPKAGEGRGFSQAQLLRQRYGYRGELRARGALKRDQLFFLARCGFDSYDLDPAEDLAAALAALDSFTVAYQRTSGQQPPMRGTGG